MNMIKKNIAQPIFDSIFKKLANALRDDLTYHIKCSDKRDPNSNIACVAGYLVSRIIF